MIRAAPNAGRKKDSQWPPPGVLNIAEGARLRSTAARQRMLDYAVGSVLECSACLDIAVIKKLLSAHRADLQKEQLCEIVKMLVGLRKAWGNSELREESSEYVGSAESAQSLMRFPHEQLDAYRTALDFMRWFHGLPSGAELSSPLYRQVDKAATSVVLNIAEGNGRFPDEDRRKFLEIAEASAVKAAAYIDLCQRKEGLDPAQRRNGTDLLGKTARLIRGLSGS